MTLLTSARFNWWTRLRLAVPQWGLLAIGFIAAVMVRRALRPNFTSDYTEFMGKWFHYLQEHGFSGLTFSEIDPLIFPNYNVPFLYLLYLGTIIPWDGLYVIKLIASCFDIVMAAGVAAIFYEKKRDAILAATAGIITLFVPEVLLNSGLWGQVDSIHTAFLVWAVFFLLRHNAVAGWILYGLAFQFKLQAIFFLPLMALAFIWQKQRWWAPVIGIASGFLLYIPSMIAGRSLNSLLQIYIGQTRMTNSLTHGAANLYQWIPNEFLKLMNPAGVWLGVGLIAALCVLYLRTPTTLVEGAAVFGTMVPFVLPQMHERYFYAGAIFVLIAAMLRPAYWPAAILIQFTAIMEYSRYLLHVPPPIPLPIVAFIQLVAIIWVVWLSLHPRIRGRAQNNTAIGLTRPRVPLYNTE